MFFNSMHVMERNEFLLGVNWPNMADSITYNGNPRYSNYTTILLNLSQGWIPRKRNEAMRRLLLVSGCCGLHDELWRAQR
jgi:hypothetical protein